MSDHAHPGSNKQSANETAHNNLINQSRYEAKEADNTTYDALAEQQTYAPTSVLIVRHGNTFDKGETLRRVGKHTDLPLSKSGIKQAKAIGYYLANFHQDLAAVYTSSLKRTRETAQIALSEAALEPNLSASGDFDEIDYGPDENKPESEVIARLGQSAIEAWDIHGTPPPDWKVNPEGLKQTWRDFFQKVRLDYPGKTVMVVTSNGIARFAPYCLKEFDKWQTEHTLKMRTGAVSLFNFADGQWDCKIWNHLPS
jgi:probable phosphoglycerate mutase